MLAWPAMWKTASNRPLAKTSSTAARSPDVALDELASAGTFSRTPVARLSSTVTAWPSAEQPLRQMRADEAGSARDEHAPHHQRLPTRSARISSSVTVIVPAPGSRLCSRRRSLM